VRRKVVRANDKTIVFQLGVEMLMPASFSGRKASPRMNNIPLEMKFLGDNQPEVDVALEELFGDVQDGHVRLGGNPDAAVHWSAFLDSLSYTTGLSRSRGS
jgi:hypothetical protein